MLRVGAIIAGGGIAIRGGTEGTAASANSDVWPLQRFDDRNTAHNPDGTALTGDVEISHVIDDIAASSAAEYLLADGIAYIYDANSGNVGAVELETDETLWIEELADELAIPEVIDGDVLAARSIEGPIYALNREDAGLEAEVGVERGVGLGYGGDTWFAPTMDGRIVAGQGGSDEYLWSRDVEGIPLRPAVAGDRVYVATVRGVSPDDLQIEEPVEMDASGTLYALDRNDGTVLWETAHERFGVRSPAADGDGRVYWPCTDGTLAAHDTETGDESWRFSADGGFNVPVAVTHSDIIAGNDDGTLYGIDRESGSEIGTFEVGRRIRGPPVIVDNVVFFGADDNSVYAFDLSAGEQLWSIDVEAPVRALTAGDGRVVAGTLEGCYLLDGSEPTEPRDSETNGDGGVDRLDANGDEEDGTHRGFFTNDPDSSLAILDDPVTLTWLGIGVSIAGITMQLIGGQS